MKWECGITGPVRTQWKQAVQSWVSCPCSQQLPPKRRSHSPRLGRPRVYPSRSSVLFAYTVHPLAPLGESCRSTEHPPGENGTSPRDLHTRQASLQGLSRALDSREVSACTRIGPTRSRQACVVVPLLPVVPSVQWRGGGSLLRHRKGPKMPGRIESPGRYGTRVGRGRVLGILAHEKSVLGRLAVWRCPGVDATPPVPPRRRAWGSGTAIC